MTAHAGAQSAAVDERAAAVRDQFRAAYAAARAGITTDDSAELRGYILFPYVRAARIAQDLARAEGAWGDVDLQAAEFLATSGDSPVSQALRRAWLSSLARRTRGKSFWLRYDAAVATPELECQRLNARIARGDTGGLAPTSALGG